MESLQFETGKALKIKRLPVLFIKGLSPEDSRSSACRAQQPRSEISLPCCRKRMKKLRFELGSTPRRTSCLIQICPNSGSCILLHMAYCPSIQTLGNPPLYFPSIVSP